MIEFIHHITDPEGLHARPVAHVCACTLESGDSVTISCRGTDASAKDPIALMGLNARCGEDLTVRVEGAAEEETARLLRAILEGEE